MREYVEGDGAWASRRHSTARGLLTNLTVAPLTKRGIRAKIAGKFGYRVGINENGEPVQVADYRDAGGSVIAQHVRGEGKVFSWRGDVSNIDLFGQHLWPRGGRMIVVTEGEIDCLSVAELQDGKWPVVSIWCGAAQPEHVAKVKNHVARYAEFLSSYDKVVFLFDNDEPGRASAKAAASTLAPGKAAIAQLPLKDVNEMLVAGRGDEVLSAIWNAAPYRPDGLVSVADVVDLAKTTPTMGLPWPWPSLTELTYGRRRGEIYGIGGGTGIGKSDFLSELIVKQVELGLPTAAYLFESGVREAVWRIAGKLCNKTFHIPGSGWTEEQLHAAVDDLAARGLVYLYDHRGATDWAHVQGLIRYQCLALGVRDFIIDPITAFTAHMQDENVGIKALMEELSSLAANLDVSLYFVSHLSTPEGKPHEEGGRVQIKNFRGSRAIGYWSNFLIGLERDQQAEDVAVRRTTTVRILKDRYSGQATGSTITIQYQPETGRLLEVPQAAAFAFSKVDGPQDNGDDVPF